jgi:hypothetical protein
MDAISPRDPLANKRIRFGAHTFSKHVLKDLLQTARPATRTLPDSRRPPTNRPR